MYSGCLPTLHIPRGQSMLQLKGKEADHTLPFAIAYQQKQQQQQKRTSEHLLQLRNSAGLTEYVMLIY